jgi:CRISPR-associated protein Csd2
MSSHLDATKRHDVVFLFDVTNGNPNGDPDAGNLPRIDPETMHGLVTDVSIKRKIRDYVDVLHGTKPRFQIFIQSKGYALNDLIDRSREANQSGDNGDSAKGGGQEAKRAGIDLKRQQEQERRKWMCDHFYDVRTFGAVMSTGDYPAGQVRGPVQLTFARSIDPVVPLDLAITRVAITKAGDDKTTEMGRKAVLPYALFMGHVFITPHFAQQTRFSAEDLTIFWQALTNCWEMDHSASRGLVALRGLYVFSHENSLGNAPSHQLFERIQVNSVPTARSFRDYTVTVQENVPAGITLTRLVG